MEEPPSSSARSDDRSLKTAESLRALRDQADQTLADHRQRVNETETRINEQLQRIADELARSKESDKESDKESAAASDEQAAILEQLHQTLAEKEAEVEEVFEQLAAQSLEFESQIAERDDELEQVLQLGEEEGQQRESLQEELDSAQQALEDLRANECDACTQKNLELTDAEQKIAELTKLQQDATESAEQLEQTRRKFELALADVHKLKRENADLHEELLSRPVANDLESPELVSLRAERDALAERVAELESAPTPTSSADEQQELEDLQRRFELAVDDVRELKQENTDLQQQLASASAAASTRSSDDSEEGPQDWQAQKARLIAALDAEEQGNGGIEIDEPRRADRATIEGTISITDRVVAEKDAALAQREVQLEDLRAQLEAKPEGQDLEELREQITAEIFGDDEAIQTEVGRLQQQQKQLDTKLREAELEISVQRATLAREQSALEEKLAQLPDENAEDPISSAGKPRRRWLSALGLKDEDES